MIQKKNPNPPPPQKKEKNERKKREARLRPGEIFGSTAIQLHFNATRKNQLW